MLTGDKERDVWDTKFHQKSTDTVFITLSYENIDILAFKLV